MSQPVADAPYGLDQLRPSELLSQLCDVDVHRSRSRGEGKPPDAVEQPLARHDLAGTLRELGEGAQSLVEAAVWTLVVPIATLTIHRALTALANRQGVSPASASAARWPAHVVAFAPGPGTAAALDEAGVTLARTPDRGTDSEALLALPELADVAGKRIVISTGTKTLQDQLFNRDIPTVRGALRVPVTVAPITTTAISEPSTKVTSAELQASIRARLLQAPIRIEELRTNTAT